MATRTIYTGAGQPTEEGFLLAQKIQHINIEKGSLTTVNNKALVNTRDQPHSKGGLGLRRLHVTCGDANMSPWATRMKYGATSIVLRLLEHDIDISDLYLQDSLKAAKQVAKDVSGINTPLLLNSGKTATALDIQESIAERVLTSLSEKVKLPQEEEEVALDLISIVDALRRYRKNGEEQPLLRQLDWYTKYEIIESYKQKHGSITQTRREYVDLIYDQIPNGLGVRLRKDKGRFAPYTPSREEIELAKITPSPGRSRLLGEVVKKAHAINHLDYFADWEFFSHRLTGKKLDLGPVEATYTDEKIVEIVDDFLK